MGNLGRGAFLAINKHGQILGSREDGYPNPTRYYVWDRGRVTYLEALSGQYTYASGIDSLGRVVGFTASTGGNYHAVVWVPKS